MQTPGLHHITAISGDAQRNIDFYTGTLGLRLVKLTVNFDDPGSYHLYYGDRTGSPGTILTFFAWPGASPGTQGLGQASRIAFAVPEASLPHWTAKLGGLRFHDPDGLPLEIVGTPEGNGHAISKFHGVTLAERNAAPTEDFLRNVLGVQSGVTAEFAETSAILGAGTIHHVAFRAETDEVQLAWRAELARHGTPATQVLDRDYFHSIYFREPGGVLFEIATDQPGFAVDEPVESLGTQLKLPKWLEPRRAEIEARLPKLRLPD